MKAKIYKPSKATTQSGLAKVKRWILEFEPDSARVPEPLMGWSSGADTNHQVRLRFSKQQQAIDYAEAQGLDYDVLPEQRRNIKPKSFADNFAYKPDDDG